MKRLLLKMAGFVALIWAGLVGVTMLASTAGDAPLMFWTAVAAVIFYTASTTWLKRTR